MMRPLTLEEFAQQLRIKGDYRETEFADEILMLIDIEEEVAEPFSNLCGDLDHYVPANPGKPDKQLEWLGDRSALLSGIQDELAQSDRTGDVDDIVKEMIAELDGVEAIMREHGGWTEGELSDAIFALIDRAEKAPKLEYDL